MYLLKIGGWNDKWVIIFHERPEVKSSSETCLVFTPSYWDVTKNA